MRGVYAWYVWVDLTEIPADKRRRKVVQKYSDVESWELVLGSDEVYDIFKTPGTQTARFMADSNGYDSPAGVTVFVKRLRSELAAAYVRTEVYRRVRAAHYNKLTVGSFAHEGAVGTVSKDHYTLYSSDMRSVVEDYDFFDVSICGPEVGAVSDLLCEVMAGRAPAQ